MPQKPFVAVKNLLRRIKPAHAQDARNGRFVAIIDCILNQNARDAGAARFPAMNFELLQLCHRHNIGILQMPCPEIAALGFERKRQPGRSIRDALDTETGRNCCQALAVETADRIETYLAQGCELAAVLGGNPRSPGCAVHGGPEGLQDESGIFMKALQKELRCRGREAAFMGIRDHDPELLRQDLARFRELLERAGHLPYAPSR